MTVRTSIRVAAIVILGVLVPTAGRAAPACNLADLAAIWLSDPLDRSEEPVREAASEAECAGAAAQAIARMNAALDRENGTRTATAEAAAGRR